MLRLFGKFDFGLRTLVLTCSLPAMLASGCEDSSILETFSEIKVEPLELAFGALNVGESRLRVDSISIDGDPQFRIEAMDGLTFDSDQIPMSIPVPDDGDNTRELSISFSPVVLQEYAAVLEIVSNDEDHKQTDVDLSGAGSVPDIEVTPSELDFGSVGIDSSSSLDLTVTNHGDAPLVVENALLALESENPDSPFGWGPQDLELAHEEQGTIGVTYAPKVPHLDENGNLLPDEDVLMIFSNDPDPDENPVKIGLKGTISGNLAPVAGIYMIEVNKLGGELLADFCAPAPSDTIRFEARVRDPDGGQIQPSNLEWVVVKRPNGSNSEPFPASDPNLFQATFKVDLWGDYVVCVTAADAHGKASTFDADNPCDCQTANAADDYSCPCMAFTAIPREDIRIELTWDLGGPAGHLHRDGQLLSPVRRQHHRYGQDLLQG